MSEKRPFLKFVVPNLGYVRELELWAFNINDYTWSAGLDGGITIKDGYEIILRRRGKEIEVILQPSPPI